MASATPLVSVLKFKSLNARLTDTEFSAFISRMWKIVGREEILKLLCTLFSRQLNNADVVNNQKPNLLDAMTTMTSDIIRHRDTISNPRTKLDINNMPSCLVGTIASFLNSLEYISFSMTNRKVYVDCNSPNRLQQLSLQRVTDYSAVPLKNFPQIKCLRFYLKQISEFNEMNGQRFGDCKQLESMIIHGKHSTISDINLLINDSSRCFSSIRSLTLMWFQGSSRLQPDALIEILSKFDKLAHFKLYVVEIQGNLSSHSLSSVRPEMREFMSLASGQIAPALESWKGGIETLTIGEPVGDIAYYDISTVKRLCFVGLEIAKIDALLNSPNSLREISWIPNYSTPPSPDLNGQEVRTVTKRCIVGHMELEYLFVSTRCHFEEICSGIHDGLYLTKKRKRKQFEIALDVDVREISNSEEFVCGIAKIVNVMSMSNIEQWIICVDAHRESRRQQYFDIKSMTVALNDLRRSLHVQVLFVKGTEVGFVLGNGDKMKRHSMWWRVGQFFSCY